MYINPCNRDEHNSLNDNQYDTGSFLQLGYHILRNATLVIEAPIRKDVLEFDALKRISPTANP